jgi:hypothetical protein
MDKDSDGGISYAELQKWITLKATTDKGTWEVFKSNTQILSMAHKMASVSIDAKSSPIAGKVVDVSEFRSLLIHLFSMSILWMHFEHADSWVDGGDSGNKQLNKEEFKLACKTLCSTHAHEELSDDQIDTDFNLLDTNQSGSIGFIEVHLLLATRMHSCVYFIHFSTWHFHCMFR